MKPPVSPLALPVAPVRATLLALALVAGDALAQPGAAEPPVVETAAPHGDVFAAGTRLRLKAPAVHRGRIVGTVVSRSADSLVIDTIDVAAEQRMFFPITVMVTEQRRMRLPLRAIDTVEISAGRSRPGGMIRFATRAALAGGLFLGLNYATGTRQVNMRQFSAGFRTGAIAAAAIAAPFGYRRGSERWKAVLGQRREPPRERPPARDPRIVADAKDAP